MSNSDVIGDYYAKSNLLASIVSAAISGDKSELIATKDSAATVLCHVADSLAILADHEGLKAEHPLEANIYSDGNLAPILSILSGVVAIAVGIQTKANNLESNEHSQSLRNALQTVESPS